jgi:TonB family protein
MAQEYGAPTITVQKRGPDFFRGAAASLLFHAGAIFVALFFFGMRNRSEQYRRPPTFTLVNFTPPIPVSEPVKRAAAQRQSKTASPEQAQKPQVLESVPDLTDKNPVPSVEPTVAEQVAASELSGSATSDANSAGGSVDADQPVAVGSTTMLDNTNFTPIFNPKPAYPAIALKANIQGYADVELVVTSTGTIESFTILKAVGHPAFGEETAKVIRRWRFPPPRINGKPSKIKYDYRVNFTLD